MSGAVPLFRDQQPENTSQGLDRFWFVTKKGCVHVPARNRYQEGNDSDGVRVMLTIP